MHQLLYRLTWQGMNWASFLVWNLSLAWCRITWWLATHTPLHWYRWYDLWRTASYHSFDLYDRLFLDHTPEDN